MMKLSMLLLTATLVVAVGGVIPGLQNPLARAILTNVSASAAQSQAILKTDGGPGLFIWPDRWYLSSLTISQQQAIAQRNDAIWRDAVDKTVNATMKAANPNLRIIGYVNAIWIWSNHNDFIWSYDYINANHPEWFLKDANGNRIISGAHYGVMLDLGNPGFQQYIADAALRAISGGANGIYIDDAHEIYPSFYSASGYPINPRTGAPYTNAEWAQDTYNLIKKAHDTVRAAYPGDYNKLVFYNGYIHGWQGESFMPVADGAMSEGFVHAYWESASSFRDPATWKGEIDDLVNYQAQGKFIYAVSGASGSDLNMYTYASYLLGAGPRSYYNYASYGNGWAGFGAPLGTPSGAYYYANNVYQRDYSNAKVLVNPTGNWYTVSLGAGLYGLNQDGSIASGTTSSVNLGPHSGAIFLKNPNLSSMPSPTATPVPPTPTATPVPPSPTATSTATPVPPTPTATPVPPSPSATPTATPVPPSPTATSTATPVPPTPTATPVPPSPTATPTATPALPTPTATSPAGATKVSIWGNSAVPTKITDHDTAAVELGVKFKSDVGGQIVGIRFYKGSTNTGTHVGSLWDSNGQLLARATFTNETASGWQQVNFATPVAISANTVYVASYHTNVGRYAADDNYFANSGVDNAPLHALRNGVSGDNGVYAYSSSPAFPSQTYQSSNYWVDVVFAPNLVFALNLVFVPNVVVAGR